MDHPATISIGHSPSAHATQSNLRPSAVNINVAPRYQGIADQSAIFASIENITKGDGTVRDVKLNGRDVPREYVLQAMFNNQDFMPQTDQFPVNERPAEFIWSQEKQKSMFGPINRSPLFHGLAMDVIGSGEDTSVNISQQGGRYGL